jgi:peptidoglycan/LPS O-acetylase OafA/YrhL
VTTTSAGSLSGPPEPRGASARGMEGGGYVPALDGVRGLAILVVVCVHSGYGGRPEGPVAAVVREVFSAGWAGVDLFFVMSGLLITGILLDTRSSAGYFRSFYARRTLRIFPLYYVALLLMLVVLPATGLLNASGGPHPGDAWVWTYLLNVKVALSPHQTVVPFFVFPFWSLSVEEQFYMVWPLMVWLLPRRALTWTAGGMIVAALLLRVALVAWMGTSDAPYVLTVTRMDALAVGALIAIALRAPGWLDRWRRAAPAVLVVCTAAVVGLMAFAGSATNSSPGIQTIGFSLVAFAAGALLVMVLTSAPAHPLTRVFSWRPLRYLGERSYGVYVWHVLVLTVVLRLRLLDRLFGVQTSHPAHQVLIACVDLLVTLAVAEVSWRVLEAPFLKLKRYVPRPAAAPEVPPRPAVT